jgi:chemotaxis protein CheX
MDTSLATRAQEENWLPILELSVEEVFEIMLGCRVKPTQRGDREISNDFTSMVGLAGALCGILTVSCDRKTATELATCMLGPEIAGCEDQISDGLGEICNMIAGNFKNKLSGSDGRCMLSVPTVIKGEQYSFYSLAEGEILETVMLFKEAPVSISLQLHS